MKIQVSRVLDEGLREHAAYDPSALDMDRGDIRLTEPFEVDAFATKTEGDLVVTVEVDASVEAEWNRWYDAVHVPDVLACPGVVSGRRYLASGDISESDPRGRTVAGR